MLPFGSWEFIRIHFLLIARCSFRVKKFLRFDGRLLIFCCSPGRHRFSKGASFVKPDTFPQVLQLSPIIRHQGRQLRAFGVFKRQATPPPAQSNLIQPRHNGPSSTQPYPRQIAPCRPPFRNSRSMHWMQPNWPCFNSIATSDLQFTSKEGEHYRKGPSLRNASGSSKSRRQQ